MSPTSSRLPGGSRRERVTVDPRLPDGVDGSVLHVTVSPDDGDPRSFVLDLRRDPEGSYVVPGHADLFRTLRRVHGRALDWRPVDDVARPGYEERRAARRAAAAERSAK